MGSKKFVMPTLKQFLEKKILYDEKPDPVWISIEKDMRDKAEKGIKPYNETVGTWLRFLKDLKHYQNRLYKLTQKKLEEEVGPPWYRELSMSQRNVLAKLKDNIHKDLLEDIPIRVRQALLDLGITLKFPKTVLMIAMKNCFEDPGVFIWDLYKATYKQSPSELRGTYDMNATIMMSSLVCIDLDECIKHLTELLRQDVPAKPKPRQGKNMYYEPKCRYGVYLQKMRIASVSNHGDGKSNNYKPPDLDYKLHLRSETSYENLYFDTGFLEKRKERNKKAAQIERVCNYKFWEPPTSLRNTDPKMAAYIEKLKMIKLKAKARFKSKYENAQYHITGIAYIKGQPQYILTNVALLPTGYIPINGGMINCGGENVTQIHGYWKFPVITRPKCPASCNCLAVWEETVMKYVKKSKCKCGHLYDFYNSGTPNEKYFYPSSKSGPYWFDKAKIYQMDPMEDFIKDTVQRAVESDVNMANPAAPAVSAAGVKVKDLLKAFLADLYDTSLLIPHLPKAYLLNNLQEWVRKRVRGKMELKQHLKNNLQSQRSWLSLKHMDFKARAFRIPFTQEELHHITWAHRHLIQNLFTVLMQDFVTRNRLKQLEQTRLWWPSMFSDSYPSKSFLEVFFTYMPGRLKDTFLINPYSSQLVPKYRAKTCPLRL